MIEDCGYIISILINQILLYFIQRELVLFISYKYFFSIIASLKLYLGKLACYILGNNDYIVVIVYNIM